MNHARIPPNGTPRGPGPGAPGGPTPEQIAQAVEQQKRVQAQMQAELRTAKREAIATAILSGLCASGWSDNADIIEVSVRLTDKLIARLAEPPTI